MSSALEGVAPRRPSRRARASERATCWTSWREICDRSGRARQRDAAVRFVAPSAPDNAMLQSPGALLQCVAAVRRAADAVASIFWCSLLSTASTLCTAGDAVRRDWQPSSTQCVQNTTITTFRPYSSGNLRVERWGVLCRRLLGFVKKYSRQKSAGQRLAVAWTSCLGAPVGAPPGAMAARRPARWLR